MTFTITIPTWLPVAYLLIGLVGYLPMEYADYRRIYQPGPYWSGLWAGLRKRPWVPLLVMVIWPYVLWQTVRVR